MHWSGKLRSLLPRAWRSVPPPAPAPRQEPAPVPDPGRIVMTLLVRDEERILRDHLDYHLARGVDFFLVCDHLSSDSTPDVLQEYATRGVLAFQRETEPGYYQAKWVTRMARDAALHHGAQWVLHSDADEFWVPAEGDSIRPGLAAVRPKAGIIKVPRHDFLCPWELESPGPRVLISRELPAEAPIPKVLHRADPEVVIEQGNHGATSPNLRVSTSVQPLVIFHYPHRGRAQFTQKIAMGGQAYQLAPDLPPDIGHQWRKGYEALQQGEFRQELERRFPTLARIHEMIARGQACEDRRVADFLQAAVPR